MAPPAAPRPAPTRPPSAPGFAMRSARSPPVEQSAGTVATVVVRETAGVGAAASAITGRAFVGCSVRRARTGVAAADASGAGATTGCTSVVAPGRAKYAVVTPVMRAVARTRAMPIEANFQWLYIYPSTQPYDDERMTTRIRAVFAGMAVAASVVVPAPARGDGIMLVTAGAFWMGSDNGPAEERPRHRVYVADFLNAHGTISAEHERRYDEDAAHARIHLIRLGMPPHPKDGQPVRWIADPGWERSPAIVVSWFGARDFCRSRGARPPTGAAGAPSA